MTWNHDDENVYTIAELKAVIAMKETAWDSLVAYSEASKADLRAEIEALRARIAGWAETIERNNLNDDAADGVTVGMVIAKEMRAAVRGAREGES